MLHAPPQLRLAHTHTHTHTFPGSGVVQGELTPQSGPIIIIIYFSFVFSFVICLGWGACLVFFRSPTRKIVSSRKDLFLSFAFVSKFLGAPGAPLTMQGSQPRDPSILHILRHRRPPLLGAPKGMKRLKRLERLTVMTTMSPHTKNKEREGRSRRTTHRPYHAPISAHPGTAKVRSGSRPLTLTSRRDLEPGNSHF